MPQRRRSRSSPNRPLHIAKSARYQAAHRSRRPLRGRNRIRAIRHKSAQRVKRESMATKASSAEGSQDTAVTGGEGEEGLRRRDYLKVGAVAFAGVGGLATLGPLLAQISPSVVVQVLATMEVE